MIPLAPFPRPLPPSLRAAFERLGSQDLASVEAACRQRLRIRPHLLMERVTLALCLSASHAHPSALVEWDEAVYRAERSGDWELLEGCLALMGHHHPREALSVLEALSVALPPMSHACLKADLLAGLGDEAAAEETVLQALAIPWQARPLTRERPPAYLPARTCARCDPGHQRALDPLLSLIPVTGVSGAQVGGTDGTEGQHGTLDPLALRVG